MKAVRTMLSARAAKAYAAAASAGLAFAIPVAGDGVDLPELLGIAAAALGAFQLTYWTSNAKTPPA